MLLLNILIWVAASAAAGVFVFMEAGRRSDARQQIRLLTDQLARYGSRADDEATLAAKKSSLTSLVTAERARFYAAQEMDPYRFGIIIRDLLTAEGLEIGRYQTLDSGGKTFLEFSVSGSSLALARFLQKVSTSDKYWSIPLLTINAQTDKGTVQAVFRISYERVDETSR